MQVTIFGASGKVGSLAVEEALRRGYTVVAFIHNRELFVPNNRLITKKGDIYNADDIAAALKGSDAVISCLGSWGTQRRNVLTTAMQTIIPAMEQQNISRIVTLTGSGANQPGHKAGRGYEAMMKLLSPLPAGKVFKDGEEHMRMLAQSSLAWTTVRSPIMNNFGGKKYKLSLKPGLPISTISRQAVANSLLDQLDATDFVRQAPIIHRQ